MERDSASTGPRNRLLSLAGVTAAPLFHAAWLFAVGITLARGVWLRPGILLVALTAMVAVCVMAALWAPRTAWAALALVWVLLGVWSAQMEPQPAPAPRLLALSDGLMRTVEGTIIHAGPVGAVVDEDEQTSEEPEPGGEITQRLDLRVASAEVVTDTEDRMSPVDGGVRLTARWGQGATAEPFRCGEGVRVLVRMLPPVVYHDPGAWSRADYLLDQGITATASVERARIERMEAGESHWWGDGGRLQCWVSEAQRTASARLMMLPDVTRKLPPGLRIGTADAVMLAAMVTGDHTFLSHSLRVGFERTGSFHMLVVSGLHLGIVAGCVFWILKRLRVPRGWATLLTLAAALGYAMFTGFATPVQRSLWMVALYLVGRVVYRQRSALNTVGFAALVLLAVSPRSLFESGFQMTLLAVVAIAGIAGPLLEATIQPFAKATRDLGQVAIDAKLTPRVAQFRLTLRMLADALGTTVHRAIGWRMLPWSVRVALRMVELVVVAVVVELAMTLPMAVYFHRITVMALPVNLLIVPLLVMLVPAALATSLTLMMWPAAAVVPAAVVAVLLHGGVWMVRWFGSVGLADMRVSTPLLGQAAIFCGFVAAAMVLARGSRWQRRAAWGALALAAVVAVLPRAVEREPGALLVEAVDVGQGDSLLLITPEGKTLLVDGGGIGGGPQQRGRSQFDVGEEVVSAALWSRGIRRLDVVALSHAHSDHMGGLPAVLRNFRPREMWVGNNPPVKAYQDLLAEAAELQVPVRALRAGDSAQLGSASVSVLAPMADYQPGAEPGNNDSLVLHVKYGSSSVMLEGDAEAPVERAMLAEQGLNSTLLKVGHHGSATSTTPDFLGRVAPQWAVISCGLRNRYGHPRPEVLEELEAARVRTLSTDLGGATCFRLDGKGVSPVACQ